MTPRVGHFPPSAIGDETIRTALQAGLRRRGSAATITRIERRLSDYASSYSLEELDVELDDGSRLELMIKNLSRGAMNEYTLRVKPSFLFEPRREIDVYREIVEPQKLGAALYVAHVDTESDACWLAVERIQGLRLCNVGEIEIWTSAVRWLAGMHHRLAQLDIDRLKSTARLIVHDAAYYRLWLIRAEKLWSDAGSPSSLSRPAFDHLRGRYHRVVERLLTLPRTVVHGEFYASNVLTATHAGGVRVCPVDWEMAAVAPGLIDLAALTLGTWTDEARRAFLTAYREALPREARMSLDDLVEAVDYCQLHLAMQWLGWFGSHPPYPDHARDWLAEAVVRAERLRL